MEICRLDILILKTLKSNKAVNEYTGMSITELSELGLASRRHLARKTSLLEEEGYIKQGVKNGKGFTYFITEKGMSETNKYKRDIETA